MAKRNFSAVADLWGRPCQVNLIHGGNTIRLSKHDYSSTDAGTSSTEMEACQNHQTAHYFDILLEAARPVLTPRQIEAVEQVIVRHRTLHEVAAERGGSAEAWRQRLEGRRGRGGIKDKAPELYAIWVFRNRTRHDISHVLNAIRGATQHRCDSRNGAHEAASHDD